MSKPIKIFISYSHNDEHWKDMLQTKLKLLERQGDVTVWEDRQIEPGQKWFQEIESQLSKTDVAIFFVSDHSLVSEFITNEELPRLLTCSVRVIPILIESCGWQRVSWLSELQMMPRDGVALRDLTTSDQKKVLDEVIDGICPITCTKPPLTVEVEEGKPLNNDSEQINEIISILETDVTGLLVQGCANALSIKAPDENSRAVAYELDALPHEQVTQLILDVSESQCNPRLDSSDRENAEVLFAAVAKLLSHFCPEVKKYSVELKKMLDGLETQLSPLPLMGRLKILITYQSLFSDDFVKFIEKERLDGLQQITKLVVGLSSSKEKELLYELTQIYVALLYLNGAISSRFFSAAASMMSVELAVANQRQSKPDFLCSESASPMTRLRGRGAIHEDEIVKEPGILAEQSNNVVLETLQAATVPLHDKAQLIMGKKTYDNSQSKWEEGLDTRTVVLLKRLDSKSCCPYIVFDENNAESIFVSETVVTELQKRYPTLKIEKYNGKHLSEEEAELALSLEDLMDKLKG